VGPGWVLGAYAQVVQGVLEIPPDLASLGEFLGVALGRVSRRFDGHLASDLPAVDSLCRHVERYRGKMLRPSVLLLSGLAAHPARHLAPHAQIGDDHVTLAAVVEMVHMATLVHDDILDEAEVRRRGATINHLHGNEAAVILGDYLIASAYDLCSRLPTPGPARAVARASAVLCTGELLQLHHRNDFSLDEATYLEIIDRKTAELVAVAAELGAGQSGADATACRAMASFARSVGSAFQIQDDLLDLLGSADSVGKPTGKDLEKGKMTLPLIHHLAHARGPVRGRTLRLLAASREAEARHEAANIAEEVLAGVRETGSVEYTRARAGGFIEAGVESLARVPESPARRLLAAMARAVLSRDR
jgi:octaprenyl-diphosphate synthase